MTVVVTAAVEGVLDEAVARRLIQEAGAQTGRILGKEGRTRLLQKLNKYNRAAQHSCWFVMADLDRTYDCAPSAVEAWLPACAPGMCFRICVQEVEAWLLADRVRMARFLGVAQSLIPRAPEELTDPKQTLVNLARRSRKRAVREGLVPSEGSRRTEGKTYSSDLSGFVRTVWNPEEAAKRCPSLRGAQKRLHALITSDRIQDSSRE